jgi:hypothetical protein
MQAISYRLSAADLVDARGYVHGNLPVVRVVRLIPFALSLGCLLRCAYLASQRDWDELIGPAGLLLVGLALIAWVFVANRLLLPPSARKQLARDKTLQGDIVVSWDAQRVLVEGSHAQSQWPWSDFYRWQESPGGLLLWRSDRLYWYLPKSSLSTDQIAEVREHLIAALGSSSRPRKANTPASAG